MKANIIKPILHSSIKTNIGKYFCPKDKIAITDNVCAKCKHLRMLKHDSILCIYGIDGTITFKNNNNQLESLELVNYEIK